MKVYVADEGIHHITVELESIEEVMALYSRLWLSPLTVHQAMPFPKTTVYLDAVSKTNMPMYSILTNAVFRDQIIEAMRHDK